MKALIVPLAVVLGSLSAWHASADEAPQQVGLASMSDQQLQSSAVDLLRKGGDESCALAPILAEMGRLNPERMPQARYVQAMCADAEQRYTDARRLLSQAENAASSPLFDSLGLHLAVETKDGVEILRRLRLLAKSGVIAQAPLDAIGPATGRLISLGLEAESDEFDYELSRSPSFGRMLPDVQQYLASAAIRHAARVRQVGEVDRLLGYIHSPSLVIFMLSFRDYEPAWPNLERFAGDHLAKITDSYVSWAARGLSEKPTESDRLRQYTQALLLADRDDEAISTLQNWLDRPERRGALQEGEAWALDLEVEAFDARGETSKADAIYERLAALPLETHPWVVNFLINRQGRLVRQGRWSEGLAASEIARTAAQRYGTDYARAEITADRACAFFKLGRKEESRQELAFLTAHPLDSPEGLARALLCAGRDDEAAVLILPMIRDPKTRDALLMDLQDERFSPGPRAKAELPAVRELILKRPELRAEALKYVRLLPENLVPVGSQRREQGAGKTGDG